MPRDKRSVETAMRKKGFVQDENTHHKFYYVTTKGCISSIFTQTSHGSKNKTLDDSLLGLMARQCKLTKKEFLKLVDCDLDQNGYEKMMISKKEI